MRQKRTLTLTIMHGLLNGPPRVGKSTLLSRLFLPRMAPSDLAVSPEPPSAVPVETCSTGIADRVVQVSVRPSTTVVGTAPKAGMKWELQSLDDEAIGLLKTIMRTVSEGKATTAQKIEGLITAFKQRITRKPKLTQTPPPIAGHDSPEQTMAIGEDEKSEATATDAGLKPPEEVFREAFWNSEDVIQALLEGSFTFYLTDTGGQPPFQELLAALIAGPSVFFLVFKLTDDLNQKYTVEYVRKGSKKSIPYVSSFTVKEVLLQSLASIACTCSYTDQESDKAIPIKPKVVLVGTHKDLASEKQIQAVQQELKEMLQDTNHYRQKIVEFASMDEPAVTVDNLQPEGQDMQKVRDIIQRIANDPAFQISVPFPSLILSLLLRRLTDPVISYRQCQSIAFECGITTRKHLNKALNFLHSTLGVVRYFEKIPELREIVIRDPQILFDKISNLISNTFTFDTAHPSIVERFQQMGIFSLQEIERITATSTDLLTTPKLLKLLEYLHIIAPIQDDSGVVVEYFMPCILSHATPSSTDTPVDKTIPPLLVTFRCGYCPKGIFSALVAYLLSKENVSGTAWQLKKDGMARNRVTFLAGKECNTVYVNTHVTHLDVTVQPTQCHTHCSLKRACNDIRASIKEAIVTVSRTLRYSCDSSFLFAFGCYHAACAKSKPHPAIRYEDKPSVSVCCKTNSVERLQPHHTLWFDQEIVSLCSLLCIYIDTNLLIFGYCQLSMCYLLFRMEYHLQPLRGHRLGRVEQALLPRVSVIPNLLHIMQLHAVYDFNLHFNILHCR